MMAPLLYIPFFLQNLSLLPAPQLDGKRTIWKGLKEEARKSKILKRKKGKENLLTVEMGKSKNINKKKKTRSRFELYTI